MTKPLSQADNQTASGKTATAVERTARPAGERSRQKRVWVGYEIAPLDSIAKTHPTKICAFATYEAARKWSDEVERLPNRPYGMGRYLVDCEVRR